MPAVGFAIGLERVNLAFSGQGGMPVAPATGVALVGGLDPALDLAGELRSAGVTVTALGRETGLGEALRLAAASDLRWVITPEGKKYRLTAAWAEGAENMTSRNADAANGDEAAGAGEVISREELITRMVD